jgi:hypothetical protein
MAATIPGYEIVELGELLEAVYDIAASSGVDPREASAHAVRTLERMPRVARETAMLLPARPRDRATPHPPTRRGAKKDSS